MAERNIELYGKNFSDDPFERKIEKYRKQLLAGLPHLVEHVHALEIGCGLNPLFTLYPNPKWTIIEPNLDFVKNAMSIVQKDPNFDVSIICDYLENVSAFNKYDLIICDCLLHEIPNQQQFLQKVFGMLKDDGLLHISAPNANSLHRQLAVCLGLIPSVFDHSERQVRFEQKNDFFTMDSLTRLLKSTGFEIFNSGGYQLKFGTHGQMRQLIESQIFPDNLLDGLMEIGKKYPEISTEIYVNCGKQKKS